MVNCTSVPSVYHTALTGGGNTLWLHGIESGAAVPYLIGSLLFFQCGD